MADKKSKVAIIGGGISGLAAAHKLTNLFDVTVLESRNRLGGHARSIMAGPNRDINVDTGFMVFNYRNYPHLMALFKTLNVPVVKTDMTFSVSLDNGVFEYGIQELRRVFADPKNLFRPSFWKLLRSILRFNALAGNQVLDEALTVGELLETLKLPPSFAAQYLGPLSGAIWSSSRDDMMKFPAKTLVDFFNNHGLLSQSDYLQWYTIEGGSKVYVDLLTNSLRDTGCEIRLGANITQVKRSLEQVTISSEGSDDESYDYVIFACHSDQALKLLADPSNAEKNTLGAIKYRPNRVILHSDNKQMPKRRAAWSSWVYKGQSLEQTQNSFTYWMNNLQHIPMSDAEVFVTLNPLIPIDPALIYDETVLSHPQFDLQALRAQKELPALQGKQRSFYCGAYARYGFHEDGIWSAYQAVSALKNLSSTA